MSTYVSKLEVSTVFVETYRMLRFVWVRRVTSHLTLTITWLKYRWRSDVIGGSSHSENGSELSNWANYHRVPCCCCCWLQAALSAGELFSRLYSSMSCVALDETMCAHSPRLKLIEWHDFLPSNTAALGCSERHLAAMRRTEDSPGGRLSTPRGVVVIVAVSSEHDRYGLVVHRDSTGVKPRCASIDTLASRANSRPTKPSSREWTGQHGDRRHRGPDWPSVVAATAGCMEQQIGKVLEELWNGIPGDEQVRPTSHYTAVTIAAFTITMATLLLYYGIDDCT